MIGKYAANTSPLEQSWQELEGSICEISSRSDSSFLVGNQGSCSNQSLYLKGGAGSQLKAHIRSFKYWLLPRGGEQCINESMLQCSSVVV